MSSPDFKIKLKKTHDELRVVWAELRHVYKDKNSVRVHKFKARTQPDLLLDYLVHHSKGKKVTRDMLLAEGFIQSHQLNFEKVIIEQCNFNPILLKTFVKRIGVDYVEMVSEAKISHSDLVRLTYFLNQTKQYVPGSAHHKRQHLFEPIDTD